jgi:hypothetical protein
MKKMQTRNNPNTPSFEKRSEKKNHHQNQFFCFLDAKSRRGALCVFNCHLNSFTSVVKPFEMFFLLKNTLKHLQKKTFERFFFA